MKLSRSLLRREISNLQPQRILFTRSEADSRICILHSMVGDSSAGGFIEGFNFFLLPLNESQMLDLLCILIQRVKPQTALLRCCNTRDT